MESRDNGASNDGEILEWNHGQPNLYYVDGGARQCAAADTRMQVAGMSVCCCSADETAQCLEKILAGLEMSQRTYRGSGLGAGCSLSNRTPASVKRNGEEGRRRWRKKEAARRKRKRRRRGALGKKWLCEWARGGGGDEGRGISLSFGRLFEQSRARATPLTHLSLPTRKLGLCNGIAKYHPGHSSSKICAILLHANSSIRCCSSTSRVPSKVRHCCQ